MDYNHLKVIIIFLLGVAILSGFLFFNKGRDDDTIKIVPDFRNSRYKEIYFAGGCFWGVQAYFDRIIGVIYTDVGYANGKGTDTDYRSIKNTGHTETVHIVYDPERIELETLARYFYDIIDPTSINKQGNDVGTQYRSGIYFVDPKDMVVIQKVTGEISKKYEDPVVTEIEALNNYVLAEEYHQDYLEKNPGGYCHINLSKIPNEKPVVREEEYSLPTKEEIRNMLTDSQFNITQGSGTERAFENLYWDNKEKGIYVDIVTGEPLFLSDDKYDSGSGWPSFTKPVQWDVVEYRLDDSMLTERIEVVSRVGKTHLGHVFKDGPRSEGGLRYCMNSGAMKFIPFENLLKEGYGKFTVLFK
ncbi:peptide-methionine (R)-S-oxide reductase MsrB [Alkalibacter mobilis]|uniref:peptide-methionine (R)-S-oxide reductase MsrB n=1 Tax=Alkalibacter mobilis TaxID=2787712 RepID=UPI00189E72AD|nr:peptide-methionine (R)-S-oxide reductase MsrB [Alkalibacter mobilis]MBF7096052.1 peptide-methionine (R)-S-oxide reductase MsrB [Alkalibacter mobilis]